MRRESSFRDYHRQKQQQQQLLQQQQNRAHQALDTHPGSFSLVRSDDEASVTSSDASSMRSGSRRQHQQLIGARGRAFSTNASLMVTPEHPSPMRRRPVDDAPDNRSDTHSVRSSREKPPVGAASPEIVLVVTPEGSLVSRSAESSGELLEPPPMFRRNSVAWSRGDAADLTGCRCGMCGSCGSMPRWAPERLATVGEKEKQAELHRFEETCARIVENRPRLERERRRLVAEHFGHDMSLADTIKIPVVQGLYTAPFIQDSGQDPVSESASADGQENAPQAAPVDAATPENIEPGRNSLAESFQKAASAEDGTGADQDLLPQETEDSSLCLPVASDDLGTKATQVDGKQALYTNGEANQIQCMSMGEVEEYTRTDQAAQEDPARKENITLPANINVNTTDHMASEYMRTLTSDWETSTGITSPPPTVEVFEDEDERALEELASSMRNVIPTEVDKSLGRENESRTDHVVKGKKTLGESSAVPGGFEHGEDDAECSVEDDNSTVDDGCLDGIRIFNLGDNEEHIFGPPVATLGDNLNNETEVILNKDSMEHSLLSSKNSGPSLGLINADTHVGAKETGARDVSSSRNTLKVLDMMSTEETDDDSCVDMLLRSPARGFPDNHVGVSTGSSLHDENRCRDEDDSVLPINPEGHGQETDEDYIVASESPALSKLALSEIDAGVENRKETNVDSGHSKVDIAEGEGGDSDPAAGSVTRQSTQISVVSSDGTYADSDIDVGALRYEKWLADMEKKEMDELDLLGKDLESSPTADSVGGKECRPCEHLKGRVAELDMQLMVLHAELDWQKRITGKESKPSKPAKKKGWRIPGLTSSRTKPNDKKQLTQELEKLKLTAEHLMRQLQDVETEL